MRNVSRHLHHLILLALLLAACRPDDDTAAGPAPGPVATASLTPLPPAPTVDNEPPAAPAAPAQFDGDSAYQLLLDQMSMGPRWPGSEGHAVVRKWIQGQLLEQGWQVALQQFDYLGFAAQNIVGKANVGRGEVIILGAHYDTRRLADQTPGAAEQGLPVPGAVDGASGVAVLLELARTLNLDQIDREIWLAFFDVEDNGRGGLPGWEYIAGSTYMAAQLEVMPEAVVVVDMIGDADQQLYYEGNSDPALQAQIWDIAAGLGYADNFIPTLKHTMIDDHLPFARLGIPVVDIIDFDYPYWHTVEDVAEKSSPESLLRVGRTVQTWLESELGH